MVFQFTQACTEILGLKSFYKHLTSQRPNFNLRKNKPKKIKIELEKKDQNTFRKTEFSIYVSNIIFEYPFS